MFPVKGFLYAPTARTHRVVSVKRSTTRLGELVQRHSRALTVVYMTEPVQSHPDIEEPVEEPTWSCVVTINGHVRGSVTGKQSRQESMETAAKEALAFLSQLGYQ